MTAEEQKEELMGIAFAIVASAGEAKGHAYEALSCSEQGDFEKAEEFLKKCDASFVEAHHHQTALIQKEVNGDSIPMSVLLVHAQDHLMTAITEKELIKRLIKMNKRLFDLEKNNKV